MSRNNTKNAFINQGKACDFTMSYHPVDESIAAPLLHMQGGSTADSPLETEAMITGHTESRNNRQSLWRKLSQTLSTMYDYMWSFAPAIATNECRCIQIGGVPWGVLHTCCSKAQLVILPDSRFGGPRGVDASVREALASLGNLDSLEVVGPTLGEKSYDDGLTAHFFAKLDIPRSPSTTLQGPPVFNHISFINSMTTPQWIYDTILQLLPQLSTLVVTLSGAGITHASPGFSDLPTPRLAFPQVQEFVVAVGNGWNDSQVDAISKRLDITSVTHMRVIERHTFDGSDLYSPGRPVDVSKLYAKLGSNLKRLHVDENIGSRFGPVELEHLFRHCPELVQICVPFVLCGGDLQSRINVTNTKLEKLTLTFSALETNYGRISLTSADKLQSLFATSSFPALQTIEVEITDNILPNGRRKLDRLLSEWRNLLIEAGIRFAVVETFREDDDPTLYPGGKGKN